jgi:hypothetical protein
MLVKIVTFQWNKMNSETLLPMRSAVFGLILVITAGCSGFGRPDESDKSHLIQRVSERWRCLERNDYECSYEYLSPEYREVFSYEMYRSRYFAGLERVLTGVKVVAYDRDAAVASVEVGVMSSPLKTSSASQVVTVTPVLLSETWLWDKGNWWIHTDL